MQLTTCVRADFLDIFYKDIECAIEGTNSSLNLHILRIENNEFCYNDLVKKLSNAVLSFSLSRKEFLEFEKDRRYGELNTKALEKFREYKINDGEAGELLLYCFLEAHLKAPKILTKLEIKLSSQHYAHGSDGIHLLKVDDRKYQLIFGESKLDSELTTSISNAFKSIHEFISRPKDNPDTEIGLINSELYKEAFDENLYQILKSILFPSANVEDPISRDKAFAIFAGFEVDLTPDELKLSNDKFRQLIRQKIKLEVEGKKKHIKKKIEEYKLYGYTFYVYVFPFIGLDINRKYIIERLTKSDL